jgi:transglutaminase-like putative cysteine protease
MVDRFFDWLIRTVGTQTLLEVSVLWLILASAALALGDTVRGVDSWLMLPVATLALLTGWLLARARLSGRVAGAVALTAGVVLILFRVGRLYLPVLRLMEALAFVQWKDLPRQLADPVWRATVLEPLVAIMGGILTLVARLAGWARAIAGNAPVFDPVAVAMAWSLVMWVSAAWAAWAVRRKNRPLHGVVPAGALAAAVLFYARGELHYLILVFGASLLLLVLTAYRDRQLRWEWEGLDYPYGLGPELGFAALPLCIGLIAIAAVAPSLSWQEVVRLAQREVIPRVSVESPLVRSFGIEPPPVRRSAFEAVRAPGLPRSHLVGAGPELSEQLAMRVIVTGAAAERADPLYWRSVTYDRYTGRGWRTSDTEEKHYEEEEPILDVPGADEWTVRQEVELLATAGNLVHVAGTLVSLDRDYTIAWRSHSDLFGATVEGNYYQAESIIAVHPVAQLRSSEANYPRWVSQRYLALPPDVPQRVLALARDLTATSPTPYDRAADIEAYLRRIPYTTDLPAPPPDRDLVDYFLFDLRQGYCDYYASAMVVLARAAGLPARVAMGYTTGEQEGGEGTYLVTEANAHAWVEVYLPPYGWVEFEPTAALPLPARGVQAGEEMPALSGPLLPETAGPGGIRLDSRALLALMALLALAGAGAAAGLMLDSWRLRRASPEAAIAEVYRRLVRTGRRMGLHVSDDTTPREFASLFAALSTEPYWAMVSAPDAEVRALTALYTRASYSATPPDGARQAEAIATWRVIRKQMWLARLARAFYSLVARFETQVGDLVRYRLR